MTQESIKKLEDFFLESPPPKLKMRIAACEVVVDPPKMVKEHLAIVKVNKEKMIKPYYERLVKVAKITRAYYKRKK